MDKHIITECYLDTNLIESIVPTSVGYNHQKSCSKVVKTMKEKFGDKFALGIIDKDKVEVRYLKEFKKIKNFNNVLWLYRNKHHYIIQIAPAAEVFLLNSATSSNISLSLYDLPDSLNDLKQESKTTKGRTDQRFKKLSIHLKQQGSTNICKLAQWVEHLKANPYNPHFDLL